MNVIQLEHEILEHEISELIKDDNGSSVHFNYTDKGVSTKIRLDVFTYNPNNKENFLLKSVKDDSQIDCLMEVLKYLKTSKETMNSYTIEWKRSGDQDITKSYFYCHDPLEALEKFYTDKNRRDYIIYMIKVNPIS